MKPSTEGAPASRTGAPFVDATQDGSSGRAWRGGIQGFYFLAIPSTPLHARRRLILETDGATIASRVAMRTADEGGPVAVEAALNVRGGGARRLERGSPIGWRRRGKGEG